MEQAQGAGWEIMELGAAEERVRVRVGGTGAACVLKRRPSSDKEDRAAAVTRPLHDHHRTPVLCGAVL